MTLESTRFLIVRRGARAHVSCVGVCASPRCAHARRSQAWSRFWPSSTPSWRAWISSSTRTRVAVAAVRPPRRQRRARETVRRRRARFFFLAPLNPGDAAAPTVAAFQALVDAHLGTFQALSAKIGGEVAAIAPLVMTCVEQQKALIAEAARSKKPDAGAMAAVLKPLSDSITAVTDFQGKSRSAKDKNNVFGVGEGIGIFGWVAVEPTPGPYASEMMGASKFYLDKVLREFKGKDEDQVNWTNAYTSFLADLIKYIKQYHTTGLAWNPRGGAAQAPSASAAAKPAAAAPAAAKPAAAASPAKPAAAAAAGKPAAGGAGAPMLFAELNKGGAITSGLKKVAREETNKGMCGAVVVRCRP